MARNKIVFGVGAGVVSLAVDGVAGMLLLRLLARYLPPESAGYWILVTTTGSLLTLLQCGLGPSVARRVAQDLARNDAHIMARVVATVRRALLFVVAGVLLASLLFYMVQLRSSAAATGLPWQATVAWFIFASSIAVNLFGQGYLFILNGLGHVGWDKVLRTLTSGTSIIVAWWLLANGQGVLALALTQLVVNLLFLAAARAKFRSIEQTADAKFPPDKAVLKDLFSSGGKLLVLNITGFAVTNFGIFIAERRFGLGSVLPLSAMLKVGALLLTIGNLVPTMSFPYTAGAYARGDFKSYRRYYLRGVGTALLIFFLLAVPLYVYSDFLFQAWLGPGKHIDRTTFLLVLLFHAIVVHHSAHSLPVLAAVGSAFLVPSIVNSVAVVALIALMPDSMQIRGVVVGMILGTFIPSLYVAFQSWQFMQKASRANFPATPVENASPST